MLPVNSSEQKLQWKLAVNWPDRVNKLILAGAEFWEESQAVDLKEPDNFTTTVEIKKDGSHLMEWWRGHVFGEIIQWIYLRKE